jgi:uncharacterized protein (DUF2235 family)
MKRIAIFFDGTANRSDAAYQTNVVLLSRCVMGTDEADAAQIVQYYQGVGTGRGSTWVAKTLDRTMGGALAFGLIDVVEEAYRALAFVYEPGDELYVFGFSRGAFTARVFCGLIRSCGIPPRRYLQRIPEAMVRHLDKGDDTHPDHPSSIAFRAGFAPETATSMVDLEARRGEAILLGVRFLGLWDTVKSFAVAQGSGGGTVPTPKFFHDLDLSSMVESVRHAMAVDERRALYPVVPIANIDVLNTKRPADVPWYQQAWFPGVHGSVGGGGHRVALSSITLRWMAIGAARAGLRLNPEELDRLAWQMDCQGPLENKFGGLSLAEMLLALIQGDRGGPETAEGLSLAALERCLADEGYRPRTLRQARRALAEMDEEAVERLRRRAGYRDGGLTFLPGSPYWLPRQDE